MRSSLQVRWAYIAWLWLLVLLTGNLLHPLAHESVGGGSDCMVCVLQSLPAIPDDGSAASQTATEPSWEPVRITHREPPLKPFSAYASRLIPRAPPLLFS